MKLPFFTISHSNRSLEQFIPLLTEADIDLVADIRTVPRSRTNPQFNKDALLRSMRDEGSEKIQSSGEGAQNSG